MPIDDVLNPALTQRRAQQLYRERKIVESPQGVEVIVDGKKYLNFCSNDYLGLANHPLIISAFKKAADAFGVGSGASHLVCGHTKLHHALEEKLAELTGRQRALLFSTGYMANLGVITALLDKTDFIFEDKLNHASLLDAGLLSGARFQRFLHNDIDNLRTRLEHTDTSKKLICVDGVFSMDGDLAPLSELAALAQQHDAWLMIDDAHGFGVLGENGGGCAEHFQLDQNQLPILMGTLGKAAGTFGAFVAGSETLIETLIQFARTYIYTTALPAAVAAATLQSLKIIREETWRREHLQKLIARFRSGAQQLDLPLMPAFQLINGASAIQPLLIGDTARALEISEKLAARGFWISAIRPPTVPAGTARLRITLSAAHSETQIDQLLDALASAMVEQA